MSYINLLIFLGFLLVHLLTQTLLKTPGQKNIALLLSSLVFYFLAGPLYLLLPVGLSLLCWMVGLMLQRKKEKKYLAYTIFLIVVLLVVFRYGSVILGGFHNAFGFPKEIPALLIPIGIAFYTLNLISYLVDVYRGDTPAETSLLTFLTYGTLFHIALGGPVVRYKDIREQLSERPARSQDIGGGITRFSIGLFKRFLLAEALTPVEDALLVRSAEGLAQVPVVGIILGVLISSLRLYITLSAYADMAVGLGKISGLTYGENFKYPLLSCTLKGFLGKWCCTVTAFFADYVAEPLSRRYARPLALMLAYMLLGLWFGVTLGNVILGLLTGLFLFLEEKYLQHIDIGSAGALGCIFIFLFHFFYAFTTGPRLFTALKGLVGMNQNGFWDGEILSGINLPLVLLCLCFCLPLGTIVKNASRNAFKDNPAVLRPVLVWETVYPLVMLAATLIFLMLGTNPFMAI